MANTRPPTGKGEPAATEAARAEWTRPTFHRLKVSGADAMQKKADDGVMGKGS